MLICHNFLVPSKTKDPVKGTETYFTSISICILYYQKQKTPLRGRKLTINLIKIIFNHQKQKTPLRGRKRALSSYNSSISSKTKDPVKGTETCFVVFFSVAHDGSKTKDPVKGTETLVATGHLLCPIKNKRPR